MNAFQPLEPQKQPTKATPTKRRRSASPHRHHQMMMTEASVKIMAYSILSMAAISSLSKLVPLNISQQEKIQEVRNEIADTEVRVQKLDQNLHNYFDIQQANSFRQQYGLKVDPNERWIYWRMKEKINKSE